MQHEAPPTVPTIFQFKNYRTYLKAIFAQEKGNKSQVTLKDMGKVFGMSAPAVNMLFQEQRNLSVNRVYKIGRALKLNQQEQSYFEALVLRDQAKDDEERAYHEAKLNQIQQTKEVMELRVSPSTFLNQWFMPALITYFIDLHPQTAEIDAQKLAKAFRVDEALMQECLNTLENSGLLRLTQAGKKIHLRVDQLIHTNLQKSYFKKLLDEIKWRIDKEYTQADSFFTAESFVLPKDQIKRFVFEYKKFLQTFTEKDFQDGEELMVFQSAFQLFPIK